MIILQDIITYKNISCPNELLEQIKIIAEHTKNTWQSNRSLDDIIKDTTIGKIAEITKQNFIKNSVIKRMPQYGKSEQALYIATQIKNGIKFKK